ncbi:macrolide ABC transporter ATP-binding protein [candidate division WWE3 bacterium RIFCSPLOWO2_01_FULL_41_9]|uniref:Macrolide ABC transporter ATP-binding protein n=1 Tax=candidate division WWE3 bacterium RIFCSPLOWO2_01_FULL_41_9 TaxID=1802626 RepID=A0A1F4VHF9_UNCKA|nr:MAG: macrolide ABC transporter ATP-binding protein [candidate division WWE3 bacterium RIFCSPLOWO2_01_FULL_41_9]
MPDNPHPLLKAENIVKEYHIDGTVIKALDNVTIEIYKGEFMSIVGKSGSGKSTIMHILGLLDTPTSGHIVLNGKEVSSFKDNQIAKIRNSEIGFVFQFFNLLQRATSLENVMLPLMYSSVPKNQWAGKAKEMLKLVDLTDRMDNKSNELSGGQKQRVAIARALVNDPSIIFADEPTGNLDSKTGDAIFDLFHRLHEQGKTVVLVTHDDELAQRTDRQVTLKDGVIV